MLAAVAALLFLIAFIVELVHYTTLDTLLITAGFVLVALYLAGIGARTWEPRAWGPGTWRARAGRH